MTRKTLTVYSMLFLFVFTFALSLTLASSAQAVPNCCVVVPCESDPMYFDVQGHWDYILQACRYIGPPFTCDIMGICPNPGP